MEEIMFLNDSVGTGRPSPFLRRSKMNRWISYLIIGEIFFCLVSVTSADSFLDPRTVTLFGDDNIFDGLQLQSSDVDLTFSTTNSLTYTVTLSGSGQSLSMVRSGNLF